MRHGFNTKTAPKGGVNVMVFYLSNNFLATVNIAESTGGISQ